MHEPKRHRLPEPIREIAEQFQARELATVVDALRDMVRPGYPGTSAGSNELVATPLKIWWNNTPVLDQLREFAANPIGTEEFSHADRLRTIVIQRLNGEAYMASSLSYLSSQKNATMRSPMRTNLIVCLAVFELEHLPQHIEFFNKYRANDWIVEDSTPLRIIAVTSQLAAAEKHTKLRSGEYLDFSRQIKRALKEVPLPVLLEALSLGIENVRVNHSVIDDLAFSRREEEPKEAEALLSRENSTASWVRRGAEQKQYNSAESLYLCAIHLTQSQCSENMDGILTHALQLLKQSHPDIHAKLKANWHDRAANRSKERYAQYLKHNCPKLMDHLNVL